MKSSYFKKVLTAAALAALLGLVLSSCGSSSTRQTVITQILSDPVFDGDIAQNPVNGAFTIAQNNTQSVFAGIHPVTAVEYRAFLDFPLGGANGVPLDAFIVSATLDIVISSILPNPLSGTIPIRIDLVTFQPPTLVNSDYSRILQPALATTTIEPPIVQSDFGRHVLVDVTALMIEAQRLGLPDFQVRIMEDLGIVTPGRIEINDTTGPSRRVLAPLLEVEYF